MKKIPRAANGPVQFGCQRNFFELNYFQIMARFSYQNSTTLLVFRVRHSFYSRSAFGLKVRHLFLKVDVRFFFFSFFCRFNFRFSSLIFVLVNWTFVFQVLRSFYSIQHSFAFQVSHSFYKLQQSFFNFDIRFLSSKFFLLTLVYCLVNALWIMGDWIQRNGDRKRSFSLRVRSFM